MERERAEQELSVAPASPVRSTFVVRLDRDAAGEISGVVEQVRTGEKQRVQGVEGVAPVIARMLAGEPRRPSEELPTRGRHEDRAAGP